MPVVISGTPADTNKAMVLWQQVKPVDVSASGSAAGYPAINVTDDATWSSWKATGANGYVVFDFGSDAQVDCVGIAAHTLFSSGTTSITIASSATNTVGTWTNRATISPTSDEDIISIFSSGTARYWRILLNGPAANIGVVMMGKRLVFPHAPTLDHVPLNHARTYEKRFSQSITGQFLGNRVVSSGAETEIDFGYVSRSFVDGALVPFEKHYNQGGNFFYASMPNKYPLDMGYCQALGEDESLAVEYTTNGELATLSFGLRAYVGY